MRKQTLVEEVCHLAFPLSNQAWSVLMCVAVRQGLEMKITDKTVSWISYDCHISKEEATHAFEQLKHMGFLTVAGTQENKEGEFDSLYKVDISDRAFKRAREYIKAKVLVLFLENAPYHEISSEVGCSYKTINWILDETHLFD